MCTLVDQGKTAYWGEQVPEEAYLEAAREALERPGIF